LLEKDFYLTRLLWAFGQELGDRVLLKGGTLLSKVDLGFFRMSEDADFVLPGTPSPGNKRNVSRLDFVREALKEIAPIVGVTPEFPAGQRYDKNAHWEWKLNYKSDFGAQSVKLEVSIRPLIEPPRRVRLHQLVADSLLGSYEGAWCFALSADEARAEKVRAAFTREAIRDFYDLDRLREAGADLSSPDFITLVDTKLAELKAAPIRQQPPRAAVDARRRARLDASQRSELPSVLRRDAPSFELDAVLEHLESLWGPLRQ
jgi:predicted nucleotidyltransferase component of viral defense system